MIVITTQFELSSVVGKCKSCKKYKTVIPIFELCYPCKDVKVGLVKKQEMKRQQRQLKRTTAGKQVEFEWQNQDKVDFWLPS